MRTLDRNSLVTEAGEIIAAGQPPCAGRTELMYDKDRMGDALRLCRPCPLIEVCRWRTMNLEHRLPWRDRFGVAGGLTRHERAAAGHNLRRADVDFRLRAAIWRRRSGVAPNLEVGKPTFNHERTAERDQSLAEARRALSAVALALDTTPEDLTEDRRKSTFKPRALATATMRMMGFSFPVIGEVMNRNHRSVMSACRRVSEDVAWDRTARAIVAGLVEALAG